MQTGDISIQFQGFHPSKFTREFVEERLAEILEESPFGAALRASFTRQKNMIKGIVSVTSKRGKFFAVASSNQVDDVGRQLFSRIRRQLTKWKENRFKPNNIELLEHAPEEVMSEEELEAIGAADHTT
jgi:hypothetical protein